MTTAAACSRTPMNSANSILTSDRKRRSIARRASRTVTPSTASRRRLARARRACPILPRRTSACCLAWSSVAMAKSCPAGSRMRASRRRRSASTCLSMALSSVTPMPRTRAEKRRSGLQLAFFRSRSILPARTRSRTAALGRRRGSGSSRPLRGRQAPDSSLIGDVPGTARAVCAWRRGKSRTTDEGKIPSAPDLGALGASWNSLEGEAGRLRWSDARSGALPDHDDVKVRFKRKIIVVGSCQERRLGVNLRRSQATAATAASPSRFRASPCAPAL